ncbi:MAG: hypothetical protein U0746_08525 [Gemmataceae bacterium]
MTHRAGFVPAVRFVVGLALILVSIPGTAWASGPPVPEVDAGSMLSAATLLSGSVLILANRVRRK